jgi:subtilisin family serine protease
VTAPMRAEMLRRSGFLTVTLRSGEAPEHIPAQLDVLTGAARAASTFDCGPIDRAIRNWAGGGRVSCVYHARANLGHSGAQHLGFDDLEERLGMSRSYKVELASPEHTDDALAALRSLAIVESAAVQQLFLAPMGVVAAPAAPSRRTPPLNLWAAHDRIHVREAHALEPGDERVTTAVVDTGVTLGHPELQRKCLAGYDTVDLGLGGVSEGLTLSGDSRGHDFNPRDEVGHGTHVAGIIGAQGWRVPCGVGGLTLVLPIRVLAAAHAAGNARPLGVGAIADINAGMKVAVDLGADVINMSFGTPESSLDADAPTPHQRTVRYATHYGCVLVAAAGNSGRRERFFPAAHPDVIAVGSASIGADGRRSSFSTWGPHIALCAPGERVPGVGRRGYQINSGTSFASPFVAGAAALLVAHARRRGRTLTGADVRRLLVASASALPGGTSEETGAGMLDVAAALRRLDAELSHTRAGRGSAPDTTEEQP